MKIIFLSTYVSILINKVPFLSIRKTILNTFGNRYGIPCLFFYCCRFRNNFTDFFTTNNAFEIAISGIASVFIGIEANNISAIETNLTDGRRIKSKMGHALSAVPRANTASDKIQTDVNTGNHPQIMKDIT